MWFGGLAGRDFFLFVRFGVWFLLCCSACLVLLDSGSCVFCVFVLWGCLCFLFCACFIGVLVFFVLCLLYWCSSACFVFLCVLFLLRFVCMLGVALLGVLCFCFVFILLGFLCFCFVFILSGFLCLILLLLCLFRVFVCFVLALFCLLAWCCLTGALVFV